MNHFRNRRNHHPEALPIDGNPGRRSLLGAVALVFLVLLSFNALAQAEVEVNLESVSVFNDAVAEVDFSVSGNDSSRGLQVRFDYDDANIVAVDLENCLDGFVGIDQLGTRCSHPDGDPGRIRILLNAGPGEAINDFTGQIRFQLDGTLPAGAEIPLLWDSGFAATTNPGAATVQADGLITSAGPPTGILALDPVSIDFGAVVFGDAALAEVTVTNQGSATAQDLEISSIDVTGASEFGMNGGTCGPGTILPPQASGCVLELEFSPGEAGNFEGALTVATVDMQSGQVDLTGDGMPPQADIFFDDLIQQFSGSALTPTITTDPAGLNRVITFDGQPGAPINAGSYLVEVEIDEPDFGGSDSATFEITPLEATISFADLEQIVTGQPLSPTITSDPAELSLVVTYGGEPEPPTEVGVYVVEVFVDETNYTGSNSSSFVILDTEIFRDRFEEDAEADPQ